MALAKKYSSSRLERMASTREILLSKYKSDPNVVERIDSYYLPLFQWVKNLISPHSTVLIGINGPQGSGKTTLCEALVEACKNEGIQSAALSIDDFYLTRQEQVALSQRHPENPFLAQRGYPGTHAVSLGAVILEKGKTLKKEGTLFSPQYNKSAHQGQGDRYPKENWKKIEAPLDILFFEGWMLGFTAIEDSKISNPHFKLINEHLKQYEKWHSLLDAFISLKPEQINHVIDWRVEAEEKRKAQGLPGMTTEEITSYVTKFIPAYENYLPTLDKRALLKQPFRALLLKKNRLPKTL